jgi:15-cis-phytoene synthase
MASHHTDRWGPSLAVSYERCRLLHRAHGRTYYLATRLLPAWKRPHVHALYGFSRYTDEIVDAFDGASPANREARLGDWTDRFTTALHGGPVDDPVLPAVLHTVETFQLDPADFAAFLRSMAMDLTVTEYETYDDLLAYMEGSAAAIGSMMLPVLGARDIGAAREPARQLGLAFQLTNFIRDVGEDLDRGRLYLPLKDLAEFGVARGELRTPTQEVRRLIAFEVDRAREHYRRGAPGIPMLTPASQACIRTAYRLYGGILDEVVRNGYDVSGKRATVPNRHRLAVAAACLLTPPGRPVRALPGAPAAHL